VSPAAQFAKYALGHQGTVGMRVMDFCVQVAPPSVVR
jgi:hypothetical protein